MPWSELAGFALIDTLLAPRDLPALIDEAERLFAEHGRRLAGVRGAARKSDAFARLAADPRIVSLVAPLLPGPPRVARSILFDKAPEANWDVPWHQDTTIAVARREEAPGFGPWSVKDGVPHVRPPAAVLERMITIRLHLDACGEQNGPLLVVPGSHRGGLLSSNPPFAELEAAKAACTTGPGGAVLMRPLILHASRKATSPDHRRVLHLEFAGEALPDPLAWAEF